MEESLKAQNWAWFPYTKPTSDVKYLCVTAQGECRELSWSSATGNWYNDKGVCVSFNGMYAPVSLVEQRKHYIERVVELINQRDSLAKHVLNKCGGFIEEMHNSPFVLSYDVLYNLCKRYEKEQHKHILSMRQ